MSATSTAPISAADRTPHPRPAGQSRKHRILPERCGGRFLIRRRLRCGQAQWSARTICPDCFGETGWEGASSQGKVYSYSVMRRADPPFSIAYVTLAEGPTMMTSLVDCDLDTLLIGMAVQVAFKPSQDGRPMPCFRPV